MLKQFEFSLNDSNTAVSLFLEIFS